MEYPEWTPGIRGATELRLFILDGRKYAAVEAYLNGSTNEWWIFPGWDIFTPNAEPWLKKINQQVPMKWEEIPELIPIILTLENV